MNTTLFEAKKAQVVKMILNTDNEYAVDRIMEYAEGILRSSTPPCWFAENELRTEVSEDLEDVKEGRIISHDDLLKEIEKW